jgi:hypothetical protein
MPATVTQPRGNAKGGIHQVRHAGTRSGPARRAAGILGDLIALLAMFGPSSLLVFAVARLRDCAGCAA